MTSHSDAMKAKNRLATIKEQASRVSIRTDTMPALNSSQIRRKNEPSQANNERYQAKKEPNQAKNGSNQANNEPNQA